MQIGPSCKDPIASPRPGLAHNHRDRPRGSDTALLLAPEQAKISRTHLNIPKYSSQGTQPEDIRPMNRDGRPQRALHQDVVASTDPDNAKTLFREESNHFRARWPR